MSLVHSCYLKSHFSDVFLHFEQDLSWLLFFFSRKQGHKFSMAVLGGKKQGKLPSMIDGRVYELVLVWPLLISTHLYYFYYVLLIFC